MKVTIVNVSLMISETDDGAIADAVSEILSSQMAKYTNNSSLVDWQYSSDATETFEISDDYAPDEDEWPSN